MNGPFLESSKSTGMQPAKIASVKRNDHSATPAGAKQNVDRNNSFTYLH